MLLRRITEHVKAQNWTTVGLDFLIVVLGVLMAFQISAWNERLGERERAGVYLLQIAADLRADIVEMEGIRDADLWRISAIEAILAERNAPFRREFSTPAGLVQLPPAQPFENKDPYATLAALHSLYTLDGARHTYLSLISAGDFRILRDSALVRDIQNFYQGVDEVRDFEDALRRRYSYVVQSQHRHGLSANSPVTSEEHGALADADPQYAAELQSYLGLSVIHVQVMMELMTQADALIARIEE